MDYGGSVLRAALQPPSLPDLRELSLFNSEYADDVESDRSVRGWSG